MSKAGVESDPDTLVARLADAEIGDDESDALGWRQDLEPRVGAVDGVAPP